MNEKEARARFATARVARLATVRPDGAPHLVPVVFVLEGDTVWLVVEEKPKRHRRLQRLVNIRAESRVSLLVDSYDEDWSRLWWIRADGRARIVGEGQKLERALSLLLDRYPRSARSQGKGRPSRWRSNDGAAGPRLKRGTVALWREILIRPARLGDGKPPSRSEDEGDHQLPGSRRRGADRPR
jgi:PPOX class probable F420-dependent enzyme